MSVQFSAVETRSGQAGLNKPYCLAHHERMGISGERWSAHSPHFHQGGNLLNAKSSDRTVLLLGEMNGHLLCPEQMRDFANQQQNLTGKFYEELATVANKLCL